MTFPIVFSEGYSIPFAVVTRMVSLLIMPFRFSIADLNADDGIAKNSGEKNTDIRNKNPVTIAAFEVVEDKVTYSKTKV